jgi:hypothetical protein
VADLVDGASDALGSGADTQEAVAIEARRVARIADAVANDADPDVSGQFGILQDAITAQVAALDLEAKLRVLRSKQDHLLLEGYFAGLSQTPAQANASTR